MKRVELLARLKSVQAHDLYRGKDITTLTAFMGNDALELHIGRFEKAIESHGKTPNGNSLPAKARLCGELEGSH